MACKILPLPSLVLRIWVPKGWCICPAPRMRHRLLLPWISHPTLAPSPRLSTKWPLLQQNPTCPKGTLILHSQLFSLLSPGASVTFPDLSTSIQTQGSQDGSGGKRFSVFLWLNKPPCGILPSQVTPRQYGSPPGGNQLGASLIWDSQTLWVYIQHLPPMNHGVFIRTESRAHTGFLRADVFAQHCLT